MQKILIPTDFSPVADHALNYAIEIAAKFKSELLLYHVYTFRRKIDYDWNYTEDEQPFIKNIETQMSSTKGKFLEKLKQNGLTIQTKIEEDIIYPLFTTEVEKHNISLIIMGSKGASGLEKIIFGSVAATAIEMSKAPVLVVPPNGSFLPIKNIVFPIDLNKVSTSALSLLQKLAVQFDAKVTILNVKTDLSKETPQENKLSLKNVETTYTEIQMIKNINQSINDFIDKNDFELVCMIRREKGFFESIFKRSTAINQVYKSTVPLLVLPEN